MALALLLPVMEIEAFRAGTKASQGVTSDDLAECARIYDADKAPAPLVFGHPKSDSPALGLIASARAEGNKLFLKLANVADEVVKGVKERRILGRSVAFWHPNHPSNPNPGKLSLRHLGLLAGQAPAIPNMPALRFSADESELESDEPPAPAVIFEAEVAEAPTPVATVSEPAPAPKKDETMKTAEELQAELTAANAARETAEAEAKTLREAEEKRAKEFAAAETARRATEDKAVLDKAVEDGKVLPAERDDLAKIFEALPTQALVFAAGEQEPRVALAAFVAALPKRAPVGDKPTVPATFEFDADKAAREEKEALAERNTRLQNAHKPEAVTA
jgi:hypothetical protein